LAFSKYYVIKLRQNASRIRGVHEDVRRNVSVPTYLLSYDNFGSKNSSNRQPQNSDPS